MINIHGKDFFKVIYNSVFLFEKKTGKREKSQTSMMQCFNALIHILTVARLDDVRVVQSSDYVYTIGIFVIMTAVTTAVALLNLGIGLYSFKLLMGALNAGNVPLFYMMIPLFLMGNFLSQLSDFTGKCLGVYLREGLITSFRTYIEKCYTKQSSAISINENQRAFFDSIEVACAHIPAMIKISITVVGYGIYAVYAFHPVFLLTSAMIGILLQFINRNASKRLDNANTQEKLITQEVKRERIWMYENTSNFLGINALVVHYSRMKESISKLYRVKTTLAINKSWQEFLSKFMQLLSNVFYYTYFSSAVFLGYMSLGEIFILLPFIEEVGRSAASLIALPMMMAPTRTSADNLIGAWNALVCERFKVKEQISLIEMSSAEVLYYMILMAVFMALLQWIGIIPALKATNIVIPLLCLNIVVYPKSILAQLWIYIIKVAEYPFISVQKGQIVVADKVIKDKHYRNRKLSINNRQYEFDEDLFLHQALQVTGRMAVGKSLTFGLFCSSKLEYNGSMVPGYYESDKSMLITPKIAVYSGSTYLASLALTYNLTVESLKAYLKEAMASIDQNIDINVEYPSTGVQQLLYVLSGIKKALSNGYMYICIDEALSGVSSEYLVPTYKYILAQCKDKLTLVVVHHGLEIEGFQKVSPTVTEDKTIFSI